MHTKTTYLLVSAGICVLFAMVGGLLTGDALEGWFREINHPWYSLPLWAWYIVGGLYYLMAITILYRILNKPSDKKKKTAFGLTITMLAYNECWNYLFFGLESALAGFVGLLPMLVLVCLLFYTLYGYERLAAWILFPYILWLGYDFIWTYGLWRLNA